MFLEALEKMVRLVKLMQLNLQNLNIPFLGICFGMQLAIIESMRSLKGFEKSSTEFGKTNLPIISMMHEWQKGKKFINKTWKI